MHPERIQSMSAEGFVWQSKCFAFCLRKDVLRINKWGCIHITWSSVSILTRFLGVWLLWHSGPKKVRIGKSIASASRARGIQGNLFTVPWNKAGWELLHLWSKGYWKRCSYTDGWHLMNRIQWRSSERTMHLPSAPVGLHSSFWTGGSTNPPYFMKIYLNWFAVSISRRHKSMIDNWFNPKCTGILRQPVSSS